MHITKGKTIAQCISDRTEYAMNPNKTNHGELISSYACDYRTLDSEFALSKREYYGNKRDQRFKQALNSLGPTLLCVYGNHEQRPNTFPSYLA